MNHRLFFWALTSALAGFLFGFDTVVISGAEKTIQEQWNLSDGQHGLAMSIALWGMVVGSLIGFWPTDKLGRKKTLISIGVLYFASAVWSGMAGDVNSFMIARFLGGLGVGISTVVAPLYISEISPPDRRGRLAGMFQFNIVFGILVAYLSNWAIGMSFDPQGWALFEGEAWRWMLGIEALPALVYTLLCFSLVESPRWLIGVKGDRESGIEVLGLINPGASAETVETLASEITAASQNQEKTAESFWTKRNRKPITLAFLIAFFNQLSGINAILYFAPRIFELAGWGEDAARLNSIGIGLTNLVFTFLGLYLIDRLGRRSLLVIGSFGYIAALGICSWAFVHYESQFQVAETAVVEASQVASSGGTLVMACIFAFIAAHAIGQGAVIWVFISEIFPNRHRASGQTLGSFTHWIFAALLTMFFTSILSATSPALVFGAFCLMMVLQLIWVVTMVPETKGVPLEQIEKELGVSR
ncbi:sugar porter family MFS transporter [Rubripirellula obstinata]|uniref:sugar porter family MFS transporter n=1 Tax=Rubripirellula obstinata TaxID=406547 RepID=UPI0008303A0F|nr:sugar porter family MFS transporter [Rubripirellula obstinata]